MNTRRDRMPVVLITVAIAALLTVLPLPGYLEFLRPYWVALVMIYWGLETQGLVSLGLAFTIGLALDLLTGSLLGQHALSLVIITYLVTRFRFRLRFFPPWQQALSVLALLLNDRVILLWIVSLRGEPLPSPLYWVAPLIGMAVWPWLFLLLDRYRGVMRQRAAR
jgi:rod shape-determining protein MreD